MIKRFIPNIDYQAVDPLWKDIFDRGWIAQGKYVSQFENAICEFVGLPRGHACAVSSGTAALFMAIKLLNDKNHVKTIICPDYAPSACLNAIYMAGLKPKLIDSRITDFNADYPENSFCLCIHTYGMPCNIPKNSLVIEDCAAALGSRIGNKHVGTIGDIGIFSFYASKMITTGYGGMLISKNKRLIDRAKEYREFDHRKTYYPRFNFCLSDINAALGISQLKNMKDNLLKRYIMSEKYKELCEEKGWDYQISDNESVRQNNYEFVVQLMDFQIIDLKKYLLKKGIETVIPIENYELLHNYLGLSKKRFPVAEELSKTTLALPIYPQLYGSENFEKIIKALKEF